MNQSKNQKKRPRQNSSDIECENISSVNMAVDQTDVSNLYTELKHLRAGQEQIKLSFENKIDQLSHEIREEFNQRMETHIKTMKQEFSMKWDEQDDRIATIERQIKDLQTTTPQQNNQLHDHERCIIIYGKPRGSKRL